MASKEEEAVVIAALIADVLIGVVDYFKAKTVDEEDQAQYYLRKALETGAIMIAKSDGK